MPVIKHRPGAANPDIPKEVVENLGAAFASFAFKNPGWTQKAVDVLNHFRDFGKFGLQFYLANELKKAYELGLSRAPLPEGEFPPEEYEPAPPDPEMSKSALRITRTLVATSRDRYMVGDRIAAARQSEVISLEEEVEHAEPRPTRVVTRSKPATKPVVKVIRRGR